MGNLSLSHIVCLRHSTYAVGYNRSHLLLKYGRLVRIRDPHILNNSTLLFRSAGRRERDFRLQHLRYRKNVQNYFLIKNTNSHDVKFSTIILPIILGSSATLNPPTSARPGARHSSEPRMRRTAQMSSALPPSGSSDEDPYSLTPSGSSGSSGSKGGKNSKDNHRRERSARGDSGEYRDVVCNNEFCAISKLFWRLTL